MKNKMGDQREKNPEPVHIGSILNSLLRSFHEKADGELVVVWRYWDEIVGDTIAQNARPSAFKGRLLYVDVASSPWLHQLQFLKSDIIARLNHAMGRCVIRDIKFKIGV
ncbi:MAG: DUF721 domain-containing protein [Desulfobacterales bacterium]